MTAGPRRTFLALYRGRSAADARLVAVTDEPALVSAVVEGILAGRAAIAVDPPIALIDRARRRALGRIRDELHAPR